MTVGIKRNWREWFTQAWPHSGHRHLVLSDYASIGTQHPNFLRDVALRGGVFDDSDWPSDPFEAGVRRGRQQLALETLKLAKKTPQELFGYHTAQEQP